MSLAFLLPCASIQIRILQGDKECESTSLAPHLWMRSRSPGRGSLKVQYPRRTKASHFRACHSITNAFPVQSSSFFGRAVYWSSMSTGHSYRSIFTRMEATKGSPEELFPEESQVANSLVNFINYKAVRTIMEQLQETSPHEKYTQLHNFVASHSLKDSKAFITALLKEDRELGLRVLTVRDAISSSFKYKKVPGLVMGAVQDLRMTCFRKHLERTLTTAGDGKTPTADPITERIEKKMAKMEADAQARASAATVVPSQRPAPLQPSPELAQPAESDTRSIELEPTVKPQPDSPDAQAIASLASAPPTSEVSVEPLSGTDAPVEVKRSAELPKVTLSSATETAPVAAPTAPLDIESSKESTVLPAQTGSAVADTGRFSSSEAPQMISPTVVQDPEGAEELAVEESEGIEDAIVVPAEPAAAAVDVIEEPQAAAEALAGAVQPTVSSVDVSAVDVSSVDVAPMASASSGADDLQIDAAAEGVAAEQGEALSDTEAAVAGDQLKDVKVVNEEQDPQSQ